MVDENLEKEKAAKFVNRVKNGFGVFFIVILFAMIFGLAQMCSNSNSNTSNYNSNGEIVGPNGGSESKETDPYEIIETTFVGNPSKSQVQPMIEAVLKNYGKSINDDEILKFANGLLVMRKESKIGVTEMEILKNMYQHYDPKIDMANQLALSASLLELYK